jgi:phosphomannomutase/phosphoglucomutase
MASEASSAYSTPPPEIFRAYDIRGVLGRQLTHAMMEPIGRAIASEAAARGDRQVMVGRDCRASSPALCRRLIAGIRAAGLDVVDLGVVPTPLVYFACRETATGGGPHAGAMVTASHNPAEYNGVKVVFRGLSADAPTIQDLRRRILAGDLRTGRGRLSEMDLTAAYCTQILGDIRLARPLDVALDCGNATVSRIAPALFRALGCRVVTLDCDPDHGMGERISDPSRPTCLEALAERVRATGCDLGLGFDGDGDRLGAVDASGGFIAADRLLMLLAQDILTRHPGSDVILDVKCSRAVAEAIRKAGGRPCLAPSGHGPLKARLRDSNAQIAGELSGHIMIKERWFGFDDALYAGARLLEVLSRDPRGIAAVLAALPGTLATPELDLPLLEGEAQQIMSRVLSLAQDITDLEVVTLDGLRLEGARAWGLVRASNTQPQLVFRFEGEDQAALTDIQGRIRRLIADAAPGLTVPF